MHALQYCFSFEELAKDSEVMQTATEVPEWTEMEVSMLHEWLLVRSLEALASSTREDSIHDIVSWVNGPADDPFSFQTCCAVSGYHWERLQEGINNIYLR